MLRVVLCMARLLFEYFSCSVLFSDGFGVCPVFCCACQVVFRFIVCLALFVFEFQKMHVVFYLYCTSMIWLEFKANDPCTISRCSGLTWWRKHGKVHGNWSFGSACLLPLMPLFGGYDLEAWFRPTFFLILLVYQRIGHILKIGSSRAVLFLSILSPGLQQLYICSDPWLGLLCFC